MTNLSFPITEEKIHALKVGDEVLIAVVVFGSCTLALSQIHLAEVQVNA